MKRLRSLSQGSADGETERKPPSVAAMKRLRSLCQQRADAGCRGQAAVAAMKRLRSLCQLFSATMPQEVEGLVSQR